MLYEFLLSLSMPYGWSHKKITQIYKCPVTISCSELIQTYQFAV